MRTLLKLYLCALLIRLSLLLFCSFKIILLARRLSSVSVMIAFILFLSASSVCCSLSTNLNNVYNNYGCVCGGQDDERERMMGDVT